MNSKIRTSLYLSGVACMLILLVMSPAAVRAHAAEYCTARPPKGRCRRSEMSAGGCVSRPVRAPRCCLVHGPAGYGPDGGALKT